MRRSWLLLALLARHRRAAAEARLRGMKTISGRCSTCSGMVARDAWTTNALGGATD